MRAETLLKDVGLTASGSVTWGRPVLCLEPGVYVVSTPEPLRRAPIDADRVASWIERVPVIRVDGQPASVATITARLESFWIPDVPVVYIGLAGTSVGHRVGQCYRTPLGDRAPHAGGHWLKTLTGLDGFTVTWAESDTPAQHEDLLLRAFADQLSPSSGSLLPEGPVLPFANLETSGKVRKAHGITKSRRPSAASAGADRSERTPNARGVRRDSGMVGHPAPESAAGRPEPERAPDEPTSPRSTPRSNGWRALRATEG